MASLGELAVAGVAGRGRDGGGEEGGATGELGFRRSSVAVAVAAELCETLAHRGGAAVMAEARVLESGKMWLLCFFLRLQNGVR